MSSYPVLYNKSIDQWEVTELEDELRKRKLPIKGFKDDLIRRLDESLQQEIGMTNRSADRCFASQPEAVAQYQEATRWFAHHINEDLVKNILICLPVKYVLQCRSVCKQWLSLIDSSNFTKSHMQKSINCRPDGCFVCYGADSSYCLANVDSGDVDSGDVDSGDVDSGDVDSGCITVVEVSEPPKTFLSGTHCVGSCNGLVCLVKNRYKIYSDEIYLWNPATRKVSRLPKSSFCFRVPVLLQGSGLFGFGYDYINDDYKVMAATDMVLVVNGNSFTYVSVAVYSLKGNSWTMAETIKDRYKIVRHVGKYAKGSLYWIAYKDDIDIIVAFDLGVGTHRELPFPDYVSAYDDGSSDVHLTVGNDRLCLFNLFPCSHLDIWFLNDTGVGNSWSKMISIGQPGMFGNFESIWPYGFSKNLTNILFGIDRVLMWYNCSKKELKKALVHGVPIGSILLAYTESLVQPIGGNSNTAKKMHSVQVQRPAYGGRLLVGPVQPAVPVAMQSQPTTSCTCAASSSVSLPPPAAAAPVSNPPAAREHALPPPPQLPERVEPPIVTLEEHVQWSLLLDEK